MEASNRVGSATAPVVGRPSGVAFRWGRRVAIAEQAAIIVFDGVCNLCNGWVRFVIPRDPNGTFRFAALQSPAGQAIIEDHMRGACELSSVILIEGNAIYVESDAVLRILARLGPPWSWITFFRIIPRRVRNACYRFIAKHRYRWFGRTEVCQVPSAETRSRFIE
jgi:predicted DCC family thiol-disulfide oxidoreductase YuxK